MNTERKRIYLDHAATSWPKSDAVLVEMDRFARHCGAAAGRGGYQSAAESDRVISMARKTIANIIGAKSPNEISFHSNGTTALNTAIHGVVRPGDHVVTTAAEHNSVLRPLHHLQTNQQIDLTIVPTDNQGLVDASQLLDYVTEKTRLVALTHASNVTGAVQPIEQVGEALQNTDTLFLCDAAQTFGMLPINVSEVGIDLLASPGHKSSGGPLGTGFLFAATSTHDQFIPFVQGGTGSQSESLEMPSNMPSMLEAGNLNVPVIAGWTVALADQKDVASRARHASELTRQLHDGLSKIDGVEVFGSCSCLPIASISIEGLSPSDGAAILDSEYGIETRSGKHCAALIHKHLGSEAEGTLRISAGHSTEPQEIDAALESIRDIVDKLKGQ